MLITTLQTLALKTSPVQYGSTYIRGFFFWLPFCTVGGCEDASAIFTYINLQTIWLLASTMTWWHRAVSSQLQSTISSVQGWIVIDVITHWFTRKSPGSDLSIISLGKRDNVEQTVNYNGGESEDVCVCVLRESRDNGKAQRKSWGRGDQVASAVGNEDGWGRLEADKGVQRLKKKY